MASITGGTLQEQIQKAISTHGVFKFKLINMVERHASEMAPQEVAADDRCAMGEWLHGGIDPAAHGTAYHRRVVELHKQFHHAAGEVAALASERRYTEAMEAMESTSSFKRTSDQLVAAMEEWSAAVASGEADALAPEPAEEPANAAPAGWWLDSPATLETEAQQVASQVEPQAVADEAPETPPSAPEEGEPDGVDTEAEDAADAEGMGGGADAEGMGGGADAEAGAQNSELAGSEPGADGLTSINDWFGLPKPTDEDGEGPEDDPAG